MNCPSVRDVLGPHTYFCLSGNDSRMMKVSDVAHCRRIDFAFSGQSLVVDPAVVRQQANSSSTTVHTSTCTHRLLTRCYRLVVRYRGNFPPSGEYFPLLPTSHTHLVIHSSTHYSCT